MTPSDAMNAETRREWRELGFFYDIDKADRTWRLVGSRSGLQAFPALLRAYCSDPHIAGVSEHRHYGPYLYLKIMTWTEADINGNAIAGTIDDLNRLAQITEEKLKRAIPGDTIPIAEAYAPGCEYELLLEVRGDGFDPVDSDPCLASPR